MGALLGLHEKSFIGYTVAFTFDGSADTVRLQSQQWTDTAVSPNPSVRKPEGAATFLLLATEDCHIRQGNGTNNTATTNDFLLKKNLYMKIVCDNESNAILSVIQSSTSGILYITENSNDNPGQTSSIADS